MSPLRATLGDTSAASAVQGPEAGIRLLLQPSEQSGPFLLAGIASHLRTVFAGDPAEAEPGLTAAALVSIERTATRRGVIDVPRSHRERLAITASLMTAAVWWSEAGAARPLEVSCPTRDTALAFLTVVYHGARAQVGELIRLDECDRVDPIRVLRDIEAFNPTWVLDAREAS